MRLTMWLPSSRRISLPLTLSALLRWPRVTNAGSRVTLLPEVTPKGKHQSFTWMRVLTGARSYWLRISSRLLSPSGMVDLTLGTMQRSLKLRKFSTSIILPASNSPSLVLVVAIDRPSLDLLTLTSSLLRLRIQPNFRKTKGTKPTEHLKPSLPKVRKKPPRKMRRRILLRPTRQLRLQLRLLKATPLSSRAWLS